MAMRLNALIVVIFLMTSCVKNNKTAEVHKDIEKDILMRLYPSFPSTRQLAKKLQLSHTFESHTHSHQSQFEKYFVHSKSYSQSAGLHE